MAKKTSPFIPPPIVLSVTEAKKWFALWNTLPNYSSQEVALQSLFGPTSPYRANNSLINTQIKVSVLNDFYSTSLKSSFLMAEHISHIPGCDKKLAAGDISLVDDNFKYQTKLKDYSVFKEQIDIIINHFNLQSLTYREVDHYLWLIAKRYFAKPSKIFPQPNYNQFNVKP